MNNRSTPVTPWEQNPDSHLDLDFWSEAVHWPCLPLGRVLQGWIAASMAIPGDYSNGLRSLRNEARRFWCAQLVGRTDEFLYSLFATADPEAMAVWGQLVRHLAFQAHRPHNNASFRWLQAKLLDQLLLAELFPTVACLYRTDHDPFWLGNEHGRIAELIEGNIKPMVYQCLTEHLQGPFYPPAQTPDHTDGADPSGGPS